MARRKSPFWSRVRVQSSLFATAIMHLNVFGLSMKKFCTPGFNCHACAWSTCACPVGIMAYGSAMKTLPVLAISSIVAVGIVFGRLVCAFVCPFGFFQDLMHRIPSPKLKLPRVFNYLRYAALVLLVFALPYAFGFSTSGYAAIETEAEEYPGNVTEVLLTVHNLDTEPIEGVEFTVQYLDKETKEVVWEMEEPPRFPDLVVPPGEKVDIDPFEIDLMRTWETEDGEERETMLFVSSPQSNIRPEIGDFHYFCRLCPAATLTVTVPGLFTGEDDQPWTYSVGRVGLRLGVLGGFLVLMVVFARPLCRMACPLGAIYSLFNRMALVTMKIDETCNDCGACSKSCPLDLDVGKDLGGADCIQCGDCIPACPHGSISRGLAFPAPRVTPKLDTPAS